MSDIKKIKINICAELFALVFIIISSYSSISKAEYAKPFGQLTWSDSILEALNKLEAMSAEDITLIIEFENHTFKKGQLPRDKTELEKTLKNLFSKNHNTSPKEAAAVSNVLFVDFVGENGTTSKFYVKTIQIVADNIILASTKCKISLRFEPSPAVGALRPNNTYQLYNNFVIPAMLMSVEVYSKADNIKDSFQQIKQAIASKYFTDLSNKNHFLNIRNGDIGFADVKGISGRITQHSINIIYKNEGPSELEKEYSKFKADLETKKNENKKDLTPDL